MKNRGEEVTYSKLVAATPKALANAETEAPVDKNVVYKILRKRCFDSVDDPEDTWKHQARLSQNALTDEQKAQRHTWALDFQEGRIAKKRRTANWFYHNVVWTDICNSILPRTQKRHEEMILAELKDQACVQKPERQHCKDQAKVLGFHQGVLGTNPGTWQVAH